MFVSGPAVLTVRYFEELDGELNFSSRPQGESGVGQFTGIHREILGVDAAGTRKILMHQRLYAVHLCKQYLELSGARALTPVKSPAEDKPPKRADDEEVGLLGSICRTCIAGLFFLVRLTRPDGLHPTQVLGRAVTRWLKKHDRGLHRLMCWIWCTHETGLVMLVNPLDRATFWTVLFWDADLAGSEDTTKSTGGAAFFVVGEHGTRFALDFLCKLIPSTNVSTPDAEVRAGGDGAGEAGDPPPHDDGDGAGPGH